MAEEVEKENKEKAEGESSEGGSSKAPLKLIGGVVGILALGGLAAFMALPSKEVRPHLTGPYSYDIVPKEEKMSGNTLDNNASRYLQFLLHCEYFAYDPGYLAVRETDPLYKPNMRSSIQALISGKRLAETMAGEMRLSFIAEMQDLLEPIIFPIHFGETALPNDVEETTGLRPGDSYHQATFRGRFFEHVLKIDAVKKTLQLNDETVVTFEGGEENFLLTTPDGETLFLDLTELKPDFQGEVNVGIRGRIRRLNLV
ncbi:MAG: flagellar basal body-associated protein FliL, partial [Planctomycetota bacterium]